MPNMQAERLHHASCALGDTVYVFCGEDGDFNVICTNQIEKLSKAHHPEPPFLHIWQTIEISSDFIDRRYPGVSALNSNEIVIVGGNPITFENDLSDVWIFDTKT